MAVQAADITIPDYSMWRIRASPAFLLGGMTKALDLCWSVRRPGAPDGTLGHLTGMQRAVARRRPTGAATGPRSCWSRPQPSVGNPLRRAGYPFLASDNPATTQPEKALDSCPSFDPTHYGSCHSACFSR
jgi:hypothetical protein